MFEVDIIECKTKGVTLAFPFVLAITNKSTTARNISIFKELNINQLDLAKDDPCFDELYIW